MLIRLPVLLSHQFPGLRFTTENTDLHRNNLCFYLCESVKSVVKKQFSYSG
jgi:hypothetical protein